MPTRTPDLLLPRGLLLCAAFWLLGSWLLSIGLSQPVLPSAASYVPAVRSMFTLVGLGLFLAWPLMRLSGPTSTRPVMMVVLDLLVLLSITQVVVWPLRLVTAWNPTRMLAISLHFAAWTILIGGLIAWAVSCSRSAWRATAMLACLLICLIGPGWAAVSSDDALPEWLVRTSPLVQLRQLTQDAAVTPGVREWSQTAAVAAAGMLALACLGLPGLFRPPRSSPSSSIRSNKVDSKKTAETRGEEPADSLF